jgi:phosphohistidine phosphatase
MVRGEASTAGDEENDMADHTLLLMRHAKAADTAPDGHDHGRPLTQAGKQEAGASGEALKSAGFDIDLVLCSSAVRARQTCEALDLGSAGEATDVLYNAGGDTMLELIREQDNSTATLLLVGHAPGVPGLAEQLSGPDSDPAASATLADRFPTGSVAQFDVTGPWRDLQTARLAWLRPGH